MKTGKKKEQYPERPLDDIEIAGLAGTSAADVGIGTTGYSVLKNSRKQKNK